MASWETETPGETEAIQTLVDESDRGAAIIAATFLENRLEREIKSRLRSDGHSKKPVDELFHPSGPLGAFSIKIKVGFLLRIYGTVVFRELVTIKDVRNDFAHIIGDDAVRSFETRRIKDLCMNLKLIENYVRPLSELSSPFGKPEEEALRQSSMTWSDENDRNRILSNPRLRYTETCGLLAERFKQKGHFLIIGDEPGPLP